MQRLSAPRQLHSQPPSQLHSQLRSPRTGRSLLAALPRVAFFYGYWFSHWRA